MGTIVLIDTGSATGDILPQEFASLLPAETLSRVYSSLCLAYVELSPEEILERCDDYPLRIGIGAKMIWEIFPEYRWEFYATVQRTTLSGALQGEIRLGDVIAGDHIVTPILNLYSGLWFNGPPQHEKKETISLEEIDLGCFKFISERENINSVSVHGKYLFFCRVFSIVGAHDRDIAPGVKFLTSHDFVHATDFPQILEDRKARSNEQKLRFAAHGFSVPDFLPELPTDTSGVFVVDPILMGDLKYGEAVVSRVLAAAALCSGVSGQITTVLRIDDTNTEWRNRRMEEWSRPYQTQPHPWQNVIWRENRIFDQILRIISESNQTKFSSAKEDFRLLALDTVEDSRRSGVPVLQVAQLWMAIERLLSFKLETTAQVSLALSSLFCNLQRVDEFNAFRRSYGLRSRVVHGYSFKRDSGVFGEVSRLALAFREVFLLSLKLNVNSDKDLREAMTNHVLSGVADPIQGVNGQADN